MKVNVIPVGMLQTNCSLLVDEKSGKAVLVDPGARTEKIMQLIEEQGAKVELIVLTHGHYDHVQSAPKIKELTGAKLMIHKADEHFLDSKKAARPGAIKEEYVTPKVDIYMEEGTKFTVGAMNFQVLHTPGHTKGSCVLLCENVMLAGDTLFQGSCGRCDLEGGDMGEMMESLKKLASIEGDKNVICGHGGATTLDSERFSNPYMRQALQ